MREAAGWGGRGASGSGDALACASHHSAAVLHSSLPSACLQPRVPGGALGGAQARVPPQRRELSSQVSSLGAGHHCVACSQICSPSSCLYTLLLTHVVQCVFSVSYAAHWIFHSCKSTTRPTKQSLCSPLRITAAAAASRRPLPSQPGSRCPLRFGRPATAGAGACVCVCEGGGVSWQQAQQRCWGW